MSSETDEIAPDGSTVQRLSRLAGGSMARFTFAAGSISRAVQHRRVEELWYVLAGQGELWCAPEAGGSETIELRPGASIGIAPRCSFQVRVADTEPLSVLAVTMPPWPGEDEAVFVTGCWDERSS